jgi:hypothetical protein
MEMFSITEEIYNCVTNFKVHQKCLIITKTAIIPNELLALSCYLFADLDQI